MGELKKLDLLELMLAENATGVFSGGAGFGAEAGRPGGDVDGEFFFGNGLVTVKIVEFDFGSGREPEVRVLDLEEVGCKFRQLACTSERGGVHQEGRKDFCVAVLARVHIEEKTSQCALEARSPAFVDGEARAGDFRSGRKIENAGAFARFPVRLGSEIEFRRRAPAADFFIFGGTGSDWHGSVSNLRDDVNKFPLLC